MFFFLRFSFSRGEIEVFPEESLDESINLPNDVLQQKDVNQHQMIFEFQESSVAGYVLHLCLVLSVFTLESLGTN